MKKIAVVMLLVVLFMSSVFATGTNEVKAKGPTTIVMWHSMQDKMGDTLQSMVNKFNAEHTDIQIDSQFQGVYNDALTKYKSTAKKDLPDLFMCEAETSGYMVNSKTAYPIQNFIDRDKFDVSVLEPDLINYYTVNGKMMNLGFGRTIVGFIYNADLLRKAGYNDPDAQIRSWDDIIKVAEAVASKTKAQIGAAFGPNGWVVEFYATTMGKDLVNNGNGRTGTATASAFDKNNLGIDWFTLMRKWQNSPGVSVTLTGNDYFTEFGAGNLGLYQTTSSNISKAYALAGGKFEVGFLALPYGEGHGLSVGGNSTWVIDSGVESRLNAAWEWIKFCMEDDQVFTWSTGTGYAAITTKVCESQRYKDFYAQVCPTFFKAIERLRNSPASSVGAFMPIFAKHRTLMLNQIQKFWNNTSMTPAQATAEFVKNVNVEFDLYYQANT